MVWYLVYPMILGHFQITRSMPGKYGVYSADDILKLNLFIKMLYSGQWKLFHSQWAGHYIRDTRYQGNGLVLGILAVIISIHSWFVF